MKFQRKYTMTVRGRSGASYTISDPLTLILDCSRRAFGSLNSGTFFVYNLNPKTANDLQYDTAIDAMPRAFKLQAGYASEGLLPVIFEGNLQRALTYREGPDTVTEIQVLDGGQAVQYAQVERTRAVPWTPAQEAAALVAYMQPHGVTLGAIGSLFTGAPPPTRGVTWIGSAWDSLRKLATAHGGYACIDQQKVYIMAPNDAIVAPAAIPQLEAKTGLIGTPRRNGWIVDAEMLFEPRVQLLQSLKLVSAVNPNVNGTYSIQAISHRGTISGAKDGGCLTALSLQTLPEAMNRVTPR